MTTILTTQAGTLRKRAGKVRDIYDLGDRLVLVATDRISAFDWILPTGIPEKGKILTAMSLFWFEFLGQADQILSTDLADMGTDFARQPEVFAGRSLLVQRTEVFPVECVARGYIAGSAWNEYRRTGTVNGTPMPPGLREAEILPEPIFTPATKAPQGMHDENIPFAEMVTILGHEVASELRTRTLDLYGRARSHAESRGILLADTKFEFGQRTTGEILLIDEVLTPDSSRFWPADQYAPGQSPPSFDKQFVRNWLEAIGFDKKSPPPPMPEEIVQQTRQKYVEAYERLTGRAWKS
jgi:phosphoribosylaminoimidazole-succinocarboxamide synthase